jgi:putative ABC transport system permease protein
VLSEGVWRKNFGGDPSVVGGAITVDERLHTVVGIMSRRFAWGGLDAWLPLRTDLDSGSAQFQQMQLGGRLQPGVSLEQARSRVAGAVASLASAEPRRFPKGLTAGLANRGFRGGGRTDLRSTLVLFLSAVGLLVIAGSMNIAALLLARATSRSKQIAIRLAIGASRARIVRLQLLESGIIAILGAAVGITLARAVLPVLLAVIQEGYFPNGSVIALDWRVLCLIAALTSLIACASGMAPAVLAARRNIEPLLRDAAKGGTGSSGRWQVLVATEVAVAMSLLTVSALFGRILLTLRSSPTGFSADRVISLGVSVSKRYPTPERQTQFFRNVLDRYRMIPGVEAASVGSTRPEDC